MKTWRDYPIQTIADLDKSWPKSLSTINKPVKKLFYRGEWDKNIFNKSLAIVGSRKSTRYGAEVVDKFMPVLVSNKITIISGFMYGVDTLAHKKCLELGGKTVAVLGSGLDVCYPSENDKLYTEILESGGLVISEFEPKFQATLWSFPARNRIVAGLTTMGVLVVEAGIKSGSMITARLAVEMGKEVYAVPGSIFSPTSKGCNYLLSNGAQIATCAEDILNLPSTESEEGRLTLFQSLNEQELKLAKILEREPFSLDLLCKETGMSAGYLASTLSMMSLKGVVEEVGGMFRISNSSK